MVILLYGYVLIVRNDALQLLHCTILKNNDEICTHFLYLPKNSQFDPFKQGV